MKSTPDFTNKTVSFSTNEDSLTILNPQFEEQGGRLFVVGTRPKGVQ